MKSKSSSVFRKVTAYSFSTQQERHCKMNPWTLNTLERFRSVSLTASCGLRLYRFGDQPHLRNASLQNPLKASNVWWKRRGRQGSLLQTHSVVSLCYKQSVKSLSFSTNKQVNRFQTLAAQYVYLAYSPGWQQCRKRTEGIPPTHVLCLCHLRRAPRLIPGQGGRRRQGTWLYLPRNGGDIKTKYNPLHPCKLSVWKCPAPSQRWVIITTAHLALNIGKGLTTGFKSFWLALCF